VPNSLKGKEQKGEIGRTLFKSFLLKWTIVSAIGNLGERVLPTKQELNKVAKTGAGKRAGLNR